LKKTGLKPEEIRELIKLRNTYYEVNSDKKVDVKKFTESLKEVKKDFEASVDT